MGIREAIPQPAAPVAAAPVAVNTTETPNEILYVDASPALEWLTTEVNTCAASIPGLSVVMNAAPSSSATSQSLQLRWGQPPVLDQDAVVIGEDDLVFIVHPENTLDALPLDLLQQMASGKLKEWSAVFNACPECFSAQPADELYDLAVEFLLYPEGDDTRAIFEASVMADTPLADSTAILVPSPAEVNAEVASVINAFGFLPARAVDKLVKVIEVIDGAEPVVVTRPILAITPSEPQAAVAQWLTCLQDQIAP